MPKILSSKKNPEKLTFGIQGGKGSFNEQAIHDYFSRHKITNYHIKYLYTTEKVLQALKLGTIDFGQFAVHNSTGGMVTESVNAMAKYKFKTVEQFSMLIKHFLMKRRDVNLSEISIVMAHEQVFKQCQKTLSAKFPNLQQQQGIGDLQDTAKIAWALAKGKLPKNIAVLGPKILGTIYQLDIIAGDLQDCKNNLTSFLVVRK